MGRYEMAARVWSILTEAARSRKLLYYSDIDKDNPKDVGKLYLEPIQSYCILNRLPHLTIIVVSRATGVPGKGFIATANLQSEQKRVFEFAWTKVENPNPDELQAAVQQLPSCGISEAANYWKRQD